MKNMDYFVIQFSLQLRKNEHRVEIINEINYERILLSKFLLWYGNTACTD